MSNCIQTLNETRRSIMQLQDQYLQVTRIVYHYRNVHNAHWESANDLDVISQLIVQLEQMLKTAKALHAFLQPLYPQQQEALK